MNSSKTCQQCGSPLDPEAGVTTCDKCRNSNPSLGTLPYVPTFKAASGLNSNLGPYRLLRLLGQGGMGSVYEAEHVEHHRRVALKVLNHRLESDEFRRRFLREGRLAATVNHPNTVYVFSTDEIDGKPVIAMELVHGGSLQGRIQSEGPLPVQEAVDLTLQLIAGLQAAEAKGVIHRDVKPSNCFLDLDGTVKIGDFGLSVSSTPKDESLITQSGAFLGTPAFSSPEQLQGKELDLRSDIYSLGVTLYYMLTGRIPFQKSQMVQLLATVLQQPATNPKEIRPEIPGGLAKIVLRCLEKKPSRRYPNYDELGRALLPYNSQSPTPATLGLRVVAYALDYLLLCSFQLLLALLWFQSLTESADFAFEVPDPSQEGWLPAFAALLLVMGYFMVSEGVWGCSIGKAICGLRTIHSRPGPLGMFRAGLRTIVFFPDTWIVWLYFAFDQLVGEGNYDSENVWLPISQFTLAFLFISTMRRRNGYAGLHELISGTRVVGTPKYSKRSSLPVGQTLPLVPTSLLDTTEPNVDGLSTDIRDNTQKEFNTRVGPYQLLKSQEPEIFESVLLGYDDRLRRNVWIRKLDQDSSAFPLPLREVGRLGRLRWLDGQYNVNEGGWEAYEAPTGLPLLALIGKPLPWESVRFWLYDLAQELDASLLDDTFPAELELDRVWITSDGHAKLLDFNLTRSSSKPSRPDEQFDQTRVNDERQSPNGTSRSPHWRAQFFLKQLALAALTGEFLDSEHACLSNVLVQIPVSAHRLLNQLGRTEQDCLPTKELEKLTQKAASVTMLSRVLLLIICVLPCANLAFFSYVQDVGSTNEIELYSRFPRVLELRAALEDFHSLDKNDQMIQAFETLIAYRCGDILADQEFWSFQQKQKFIDLEDQEWLIELPRKFPNISELQFLEAVKVIGYDLEELDQYYKSLAEFVTQLEFEFDIINSVGFFLMVMMLFVVLPSCLSIIVFGNSLLLRALGLEVATKRSSPASRKVKLVRSLLLWGLFTGTAAVVALLAAKLTAIVGWFTIILLTLYLCFVGYLFLAKHPVHDRLLGTCLVPE